MNERRSEQFKKKVKKRPAPQAARPIPPRLPQREAGFSSFFTLNRGKHTSPAALLAGMDYPGELAAKDAALERFWKHHKLAGRPEKIIPSPRPRGYRTTSNRRCLRRGKTLHLVMGDKRPGPVPFVPSPLEPDEHAAIYRYLQDKLSQQSFAPAAEKANYLIIRGNYRNQAVIFNVRQMNGPVIRKLKIIADHLSHEFPTVQSAFAYLAPPMSDYYLETRQPKEGMTFKKLFGPAKLRVFHGKRRLDFHPTSFSQVNEAMAGVMVEKAHELLAPNGREGLLDLYCGYGLFSHLLAADFAHVTGIESEGPSIMAARDNCRHTPAGKRMHFIARRITGEVIEELPPAKGRETVILDPPRQGCSEGVIEAITTRGPGKVLHIFCSVDQIPKALKAWQAGGYHPKRIIPLDMFPGTTNLEVMILLN